jgi:Sulfotransferase domain
MAITLEYLQKTSNCKFDPIFGMDVLVYDGIAWGPPTTVELVEAVKQFPLDPSDVLVSGFPKSGTNWMQIMLANFWDDWGPYELTGSRRVPSIEYIGPGTDGYDIAVASAPPRLMKNHMPMKAMPSAWSRVKSKVVYMTRNPYEVCASFFNQLSIPSLHFHGDWDRWVEQFVAGNTLYGGWLDHVIGWHNKGEQDGVYHISYEALSRDPFDVTRQVVEFLGKPLDEERFTDVVTKALRENMDKSGFSEQITVQDLKSYRREGKVGASRSQFSPAQVALFEAKIFGPLRAAGVPIEE